MAPFASISGSSTYADAINAGRNGERASARRLVGSSERDFVNCTPWADVARWLAAESAADSGWDEPGWWLLGVDDRLSGYGLPRLAERCRQLAGGRQRWAALAITAREADVLSLVVEGLANKEIAARLSLSPRTVEKHVEALLRKLDARSRTQLVAVAEKARSADAYVAGLAAGGALRGPTDAGRNPDRQADREPTNTWRTSCC